MNLANNLSLSILNVCWRKYHQLAGFIQLWTVDFQTSFSRIDRTADSRMSVMPFIEAFYFPRALMLRLMLFLLYGAYISLNVLSTENDCKPMSFILLYLTQQILPSTQFSSDFFSKTLLLFFRKLCHCIINSHYLHTISMLQNWVRQSFLVQLCSWTLCHLYILLYRTYTFSFAVFPALGFRDTKYTVRYFGRFSVHRKWNSYTVETAILKVIITQFDCKQENDSLIFHRGDGW